MIKKHKAEKLSDAEISKLLTDYFRGGTLVEYENRCGFESEFGRAKVKNVEIEGKYISVEPGEKIEGLYRVASLGLPDYDFINETEQNGVFFMEIPTLWNYAIAPKNIIIPKP